MHCKFVSSNARRMKQTRFNHQIALIILSFLSALAICCSPLPAFAQAADEMAKVKEVKSPFEVDIDLEASEFSTETRIGFSNVTGNTRSIGLSGKNLTKYRYKRWENRWRAGARYERVFSKTTPGGVGTTAHYIYGTYRLDYYIVPRVTTFIGGGGYTDKIKGIDKSGQGFGGFRFLIFKTERSFLSTSIGYDYTYEDRLPPAPNKQIHSALGEVSFAQKIGKVALFTQDVRALEDVQHGYDVRVDSETALKVDIIKHLGIIVSFNLQFDNRPVPGFKKVDTYTDVALAVTF